LKLDEEISLRNALHEGAFRFDVTLSLWETLYEFRENEKASSLVTVTENGKLRGYAVYFTYVRGKFKHLSVLDIGADGEAALSELVDRLKEHAQKEDADLIYIRKASEPGDRVFDQKGFFSFIESIIMVALLNPHELLYALSKEIDDGNNLKLVLKGFDPLTVKVGRSGIKIVTGEKADLTVSTDAPTFLKLLLCRTSFWKELLKRTIKINKMSKLSTARRFFSIAKQEKWHIPFGDWV